MAKKIILVKPRGLCAGVERALKILDKAVKDNPGPIYCRHEIVHNKKVVEEFKNKGVIFKESLEEIPDGAVVVLSAHGTSPQDLERAKRKKLTIIDSVCPLVVKVHNEAKSYSRQGCLIVYLGYKGHAEAVGVIGEAKNAVLISSMEEAQRLELPEKAALLTQTTLSVDETGEIIEYLQNKWPKLILPPGKDICFSTSNRQTAVKQLGKVADLVLVIGSANSSNSNRLREVSGVESYLINGPEDLRGEWFEGKTTIGITAGASVPEKFIQPVIRAIQKKYGGKIEELEVIKENIHFKL
jgi:4-hydroxy-3-methylbut-2-enyl diphosphate reductase